jgi:hypothetical protein
MRRNQRHQPEPHRVGQRLEQRRYLLGLLVGSGSLDSGEQQATVSAGLSKASDFDIHLY